MAISSKKGNINRMTTQIEVRGNKIFDAVNRNNVNRGDENRGITVNKLKYICIQKQIPIHYIV